MTTLDTDNANTTSMLLAPARPWNESKRISLTLGSAHSTPTSPIGYAGRKSWPPLNVRLADYQQTIQQSRFAIMFDLLRADSAYVLIISAGPCASQEVFVSAVEYHFLRVYY
jgi:hypothetical protein